MDGNNNGVQDANDNGFPVVTVNAYAPGSNVPDATTITLGTPLADLGKYTLTGLTAGTTYRIEFVLPSGSGPYFSGPMGTGSKSSVQFAASGSIGVNFGVFFPGKCGSDPDPRLVGTCGLVNGATTSDPSVVSWRYNTDFYPQTKWEANNYYSAPGPPPVATLHAHSNDIIATDVGVPWAMARIPNTNYVVMVPTSSPETGVFGTGGASGTTAIYMADYSGANAAYSTNKTLVQLSSLSFPLTANHPIGATQPRFGEFGLGGITVSADGKYIYVVNLGKANLMRIDISGVNYSMLPTTAPTAANITEISFPNSIAGFTAGTDGYFRATAMKQQGGAIYVAGVFDGSLRADNTAVRVVVMRLNTSTNTFTEVFSYDPTAFLVGNFSVNNLPQTRWTAAPDAIISGNNYAVQPVVSGLDFDDYGALILGISNRAVYNLNSSNQPGYVISTWRQSDGTFTLENAGLRGPLTTADITEGINSTAHNVFSSGPGNNVFFDQALGHPYLYSGGILNLTGKNALAIGMTDPISTQAFGVRYDQVNDGRITGGINLGGGKTFALVGVEAVCVIKDPIEIGNFVWRDAKDNGIQDGNEVPLSNISIDLLDGGFLYVVVWIWVLFWFICLSGLKTFTDGKTQIRKRWSLVFIHPRTHQR